MSDIECVFESMAGKGSIFISNYAAAQDISLLHAKGIKAVLSVARSGLVQHSREDIPFYLYLPAQDHEDYQLYKFFNQTFDFIQQARRHCNVLVHCMAGVSRSVTIVIAYLLKKFKCSLGEVISMLQRRRSKINPNKGFIEQLKKYAQQEGLRCNFDYEEVPYARDKSCSRGKQLRSRSKEKVAAQYALTNAVHKGPQQKSQIEPKERKAETKQDSRVNSRKHRDATPPFIEMPSPPKPQKIESATIDSPQKCLEAGPSSLRKQCSSGFKASPQKKMSIQQKITKVREKLHQKEEVRRQSLQKQASTGEPIDKQNKAFNLRGTLQSKKSSKHLSEYFSLYSKHHPVTINLHDKSPHKRNPSKQKPDQFQAEYCKREDEIRAKDVRVQPRSLYNKMQQRKASGNNL